MHMLMHMKDSQTAETKDCQFQPPCYTTLHGRWQVYGRPGKDQKNSDAQPEAAHVVRQAQEPVAPVGDQPDNEHGDVLGEKGELQVQWFEKVFVPDKDHTDQESGPAKE
jgi:hypothetical protein